MQYVQTSKDVDDFIELCGKCGLRSDWVQAGGGNISVKLGDEMLIKASGCTLFDTYLGTVQPSNLDWRSIKEDILNHRLKNSDVYSFDASLPKASLEYGFHSLTKKFTVHVHPLSVIAAMNSEMSEIQKAFPNAPIIQYYKPGDELAYQVASYLVNDELPPIIFLKNHGVIIHGDTAIEVMAQLENISHCCSRMIGIDDKAFEDAFELAKEMKVENGGKFPYVIFDNGFVPFTNACPDFIVYMNDEAWNAHKEGLTTYVMKHGFPSVVYYGNNTYIVGKNYLKCKQIADVVRANNYVNLFTTKSLAQSEIDELKNWDAEKYRKDK